MGWIREHAGLGGEHEGWAGYVVADGRRASSYHGGCVYPTSADGSFDELVPWPEVVAWQTTCARGWIGRRWERATTTPGQHGGRYPDDAVLPDGTTVEDASLADWKAHVEPLGGLGAVRVATAAAAAARRRLDDAVSAARSGPTPASWTEIGRAAGMSRQSAHERWGTGTPTRPEHLDRGAGVR